jgi:hypothetical protein
VNLRAGDEKVRTPSVSFKTVSALTIFWPSVTIARIPCGPHTEEGGGNTEREARRERSGQETGEDKREERQERRGEGYRLLHASLKHF